MAIFRVTTPPRIFQTTTPLRPGGAAPAASFVSRVQPRGTVPFGVRRPAIVRSPISAAAHFHNSMVAQASRVPRLANLQAALGAIRTGGNLRGRGSR